MKEAKNSSVGGQVKRAIVKEQTTTVCGKSCPQFLIFDKGGNRNKSLTQVASGTLIGCQAGPSSSSTGFLKEFLTPEDWAYAHNRVLVDS